jgi:hypothetical protein
MKERVDANTQYANARILCGMNDMGYLVKAQSKWKDPELRQDGPGIGDGQAGRSPFPIPGGQCDAAAIRRKPRFFVFSGGSDALVEDAVPVRRLGNRKIRPYRTPDLPPSLKDNSHNVRRCTGILSLHRHVHRSASRQTRRQLHVHLIQPGILALRPHVDRGQ